MDVTCKRRGVAKDYNFLWREFKQRGTLNPPELRVFKPPRGGGKFVYEQCYLVVRVMRAENLAGVDEDGLSDPYFTVEWAGQRASTKIKFGTLNPVYNEAMYFPIPAFVPSCPTPAELNRYPVR